MQPADEKTKLCDAPAGQHVPLRAAMCSLVYRLRSAQPTKDLTRQGEDLTLEEFDMNAPIDFSALKARQQSAWASGDYTVIGTTLQIVGEQLAEACDLRFDERVLDVAAGNGNATLAAARRGGNVISTDYVSALLDRAAERANAEGLEVQFQTADAEMLPFADATFDVVLSTFGVMFAPDQERAAAEMMRVCRPGGRIGMANWTPDGFIGQLFKTLGKHIAPPPGVQPPSRWGVPAHLKTLFGTDAAEIAATPRLFNFRYRSAAHFIEVFRTWYGPVHKAFAALAPEKATLLEQDLTELLNSMNRAGSHSLVVPSEYLEVVITKRT
jgi:ubiquinone/menaquinone biosynthesis C-methylase UbiE